MSRNNHTCVLCNSQLETKEALQEHFRKHANKEIDARGKPVTNEVSSDSICDLCGQAFDSITATIRHKFRVHPHSLTKYYCLHCGMQFALESHRDNHKAMHDPTEGDNTERHRRCEDCDVVFFNDRALNYHSKSVHKRLVYLFQPIATPPPSNKIRVNSMNDALSVYYCHLCGAEYVVKFNLQQHLERAHTQEEREAVPEDLIKCTMCSALFCSKKAYDVHNTYHQPDDLYVTSEEQRLQTITRIDQDFDVRRVEPVAEKYVPKNNSSSKRPAADWTEVKPMVKVELKEPPLDDYTSEEDEEAVVDSDEESHDDIPAVKRRICS